MSIPSTPLGAREEVVSVFRQLEGEAVSILPSAPLRDEVSTFLPSTPLREDEVSDEFTAKTAETESHTSFTLLSTSSLGVTVAVVVEEEDRVTEEGGARSLARSESTFSHIPFTSPSISVILVSFKTSSVLTSSALLDCDKLICSCSEEHNELSISLTLDKPVCPILDEEASVTCTSSDAVIIVTEGVWLLLAPPIPSERLRVCLLLPEEGVAEGVWPG